MPKPLDPELERAMRDSIAAYAEGSQRFFSFFTDDARVYTVDDSTKPLVGRAAFQKAFGSALRGQRKVKVLNKDVQATENQAILAQTIQVSAGGVTTHVRQSVVWEREGGRWQMTHLHNSIVGQPVVSADALAKGDPVRVVNERIATVAAAVGVAQ